MTDDPLDVSLELERYKQLSRRGKRQREREWKDQLRRTQAELEACNRRILEINTEMARRGFLDGEEFVIPEGDRRD